MKKLAPLRYPFQPCVRRFHKACIGKFTEGKQAQECICRCHKRGKK